MSFWLRFFHGIRDGENDADLRARAILARVEKSEPARTCYSAVPLYGGGQSIEVGLQDWLRLDSLFQYRGISMRVLQQTPDGELSTKVY